jgi:ubiquinone/menaquinone biosynthesis C-methylase UbiE
VLSVEVAVPESASFRPNPRFAKAYLRVAAKAEARGMAEHRRELLADLAGAVCEVGAAGVARAAPVRIEVREGTADMLPVEDASCDAVVLSLVMCTLPDPAATLAEVHRVLRPGGQVRFYEHVRSAHRVVAVAEDLVAPIWARLAGGCHPNRDAVGALTSAGFDVSVVRRFGFSPQRGIPPTAHVLGRARGSC